MKIKKSFLFLNLVFAILLGGCGGVQINKQVFVKDKIDYIFNEASGNYTYRIALEPKSGTFSDVLLGTTTKDSKLVIYRDDVSAAEIQSGTPGKPEPKPKEFNINSLAIKPGAKYVVEDSPDGGKTKFAITVDISTDTEQTAQHEDKPSFSYLVDFKVRKQT